MPAGPVNNSRTLPRYTTSYTSLVGTGPTSGFLLCNRRAGVEPETFETVGCMHKARCSSVGARLVHLSLSLVSTLVCADGAGVRSFAIPFQLGGR